MTQSDDAGPALMTAAELKPMLRLSRRRPVSCAISMTKDGAGVVLLDRRMKPRRVLAQLRRGAKEHGVALNLPTLRFGRASVDGASDSMKVTFTVNKLAPGAMRRALLQQLRPAGYQRCEIVVDEGLETEPEDGEDDTSNDAEEDDGDANAAGAQGEAKALRGVLIGLVKELAPVIAEAPDRKQMLVGLATEGQHNLQDGNLPAAAQSIHSLQTELHPDEAAQGGDRRPRTGGPGAAADD